MCIRMVKCIKSFQEFERKIDQTMWDSKEWEIHNKTVRDEKDRLNNHYIYLKRQLDRLHISEHQKLKVAPVPSMCPWSFLLCDIDSHTQKIVA